MRFRVRHDAEFEQKYQQRMTPDDYCHERAVQSGSSFYYSFRFLSPERRRAITAFYAFCREVDDVVDECQEPRVAQMTLTWWRDEVAAIYSATAQHPVGQALVPVVTNFSIPKQHLLQIIDGMEMDLNPNAYANFAALERYCYHVAVVVGLVAARIFGFTNTATLEYAHQLGMAFQLTNILRDVREDARRGRVYIPNEELERFGVSRELLSHSDTTPELRNLFEFQALRAESYYDAAFAALPPEDRYTQLCGLIMATIYRATLNEITADGYRVLEHRVRLTPLRKLWLAWRTYRNERSRNLRAGRANLVSKD